MRCRDPRGVVACFTLLACLAAACSDGDGVKLGSGGAGMGGAGAGGGGEGGMGGAGSGGAGAGGAGMGGAGGRAGMGGAGTGGAGSGGGGSGGMGPIGAAGMGGETCRNPACGGDPTGTWTIQSACAFPPSLMLGCAAATQDATTTVQGLLELRADGTYTMQVDVGFAHQVAWPQSCLPSGQTCADIASALGGECVAAMDGCTCGVLDPGPPLRHTGTYDVVGGQLVVTPAGAGPATYQLCVDGPAITLTAEGVRLSGRRA